MLHNSYNLRRKLKEEEEEDVDGDGDIDMRQNVVQGEEEEEFELSDDELKRLNTAQSDLIGYDENELLFYVNCGEIPPLIIDLLDRVNVSLKFF